MPRFRGFIKDVTYQAKLTSWLGMYSLDNFDINTAHSSGLIQAPSGILSFSKWVSPKPTRSYPFERLYNTYNGQKIITIIPILKDEGADGDRDFIAFKTFSWMSLLNIYVVLAYYSSATKRQGAKQKITNQMFETDFVRQQIIEITHYKQSALHWNRTVLEERFVPTLQLALQKYQEIALLTKVQVHGHSSKIDKLLEGLESYKEVSLAASRNAAVRETKVNHALEIADSSEKYMLEIENYLGGIYSLSPDGLIFEQNRWVIVEAKNTTKGRLPKLSDIKDGLFKLILFSNLDRLECDGAEVNFVTRLQLTGNNIQGQLKMPCAESLVEKFITNNRFVDTEKTTLRNLNLEAQINPRLEIVVKING
jgi:hypothetical protein